MSDKFQTGDSTRVPDVMLTVVVRDISPFVFMQEPCVYRSVHIELTDEQRRQLALRNVGVNCGTPVYEEFAQAFLEPRGLLRKVADL